LRPGNRDDFDRLYRENYPRLVRTLYAITGDAVVPEVVRTVLSVI